MKIGQVRPEIICLKGLLKKRFFKLTQAEHITRRACIPRAKQTRNKFFKKNSSNVSQLIDLLLVCFDVAVGILQNAGDTHNSDSLTKSNLYRVTCATLCFLKCVILLISQLHTDNTETWLNVCFWHWTNTSMQQVGSRVLFQGERHEGETNRRRRDTRPLLYAYCYVLWMRPV